MPNNEVLRISSYHSGGLAVCITQDWGVDVCLQCMCGVGVQCAVGCYISDEPDSTFI